MLNIKMCLASQFFFAVTAKISCEVWLTGRRQGFPQAALTATAKQLPGGNPRVELWGGDHW